MLFFKYFGNMDMLISKHVSFHFLGKNMKNIFFQYLELCTEALNRLCFDTNLEVN